MKSGHEGRIRQPGFRESRLIAETISGRAAQIQRLESRQLRMVSCP
jgi:hypothetical protein